MEEQIARPVKHLHVMLWESAALDESVPFTLAEHYGSATGHSTSTSRISALQALERWPMADQCTLNPSSQR